jgi:hypothetical protein
MKGRKDMVNNTNPVNSDNSAEDVELSTSFLETLLFKLANDVKNAIDNSEKTICVIFVYDDFRGAYKLRASTSPNESLMSIELEPSEQDRKKINDIKEEYNLLPFNEKDKYRNNLKISNYKSLFTQILDAKVFEEVAQKIKSLNALNDFGFTKFSLYTELPFVVSDVSNHPILTKDLNGQKDMRHRDEMRYSPIRKKDLSNLLCFYKDYDNLKMVIRIESPDKNKRYEKEDLEKVEKILSDNRSKINSYSFLSNLISIGHHIDLRELCKEASKTIASLLDAKGCSIFLLDETISGDCLLPYASEEYKSRNESVCLRCDNKETDDCVNRELKYRCYGTTGLCVIKKSQGSKDDEEKVKPEYRDKIQDPFNDKLNRASYIFKPEQCKRYQKPSISVTEGVIWSRQNAYVDVHEKDNKSPRHIDEQFTESFKIYRDLGEGKCSEDLWEKRGSDYEHSQCILYSPLCYRERNSQYMPTMGVIRILKPRIPNKAGDKNKKNSDVEEKNLFRPNELHFFFSFAEQLSKCIINANYLKFLNELSHINSNRELYMYVVKEIPKFVGGTDCAIYVVRGNVLKMKAEWNKGHVKYFEDDDDMADFYSLDNENEDGYTKWVALKRRKLLFNSPADLDSEFSIMHASEKPKHRKKPEDVIHGPERYIGIPIFLEGNVNNNLLGVFRICKSFEETNFTKDDELVLSQICNRLSKELQKSKMLESKREEMEHYFSKKLLSLIQKVPNFEGVTEQLNMSLNIQESDITSTILSLIEKELKKLSLTSNLKVFKDFKLFNNEILKEVPYYRDHFIHQFVVYLLGSYIIFKMKYLSPKDTIFSHCYKDEKNNEVQIEENIEKLWFLTAMFHDISYPFAKTSEWYHKMLSKFIPVDEDKKIDFQSEILKYIFLTCGQMHLENIDRLVKFHRRMGREDKNLRDIILDDVDKHGIDHAVLSALVVMSEDIDSIEQEICGSSVIFHNRIYASGKVDKMDFIAHPLSFLLIFCDFLHEWGRKENPDYSKAVFHQLNNIIVTKDFKDIINAGNTAEQFDLQNEEKDAIYIYVHIEIADDNNKMSILTEKLKDAGNIQHFLRSQEKFRFYFRINHKFFSIPLGKKKDEDGSPENMANR